MTDGHGTTCIITLKVQLRLQGCTMSPCEVQGESSWKLSLFSCSNMLKQPIYGPFLGLISPQMFYFFFAFEDVVKKFKTVFLCGLTEAV